MSATVQEVAQNAEQASQAATTADRQAQLGDQVVAEAIARIEQLARQMDHCLTAMGHLAGESQRIGSILDVIKSVSEQTNLLALNAAIIGNRRIAGGVELTAALDYKLSALAPRVPNAELEDELRKTQSRIVTAQAELTGRGDAVEGGNRQLFAGQSLTASEPLIEAHVDEPAPIAAAAPAPVDPRLFDAMRFELTGLRELLEVQLGSLAWSQLQGSKPQQANLWRRLQRLGLSGGLARELLDLTAEIEEPRHAWRMVLAHLARMIDIPEIEPIEEGGVIAMVGPAGMGKTTTLAKLAARYVLKYGANNLALVSMDSFRIGAQEQLKTLGRILNVPVTYVDPGESLAQALEPLLRKRVVLW
ncbi:MAG: flagellar biosynthesis protein FlhF [Pseudomonas sp.]|nr:flagellar biosynthesis protein FlhF [Pseudomonas sp.]